jgi:hypothetical protein
MTAFQGASRGDDAGGIESARQGVIDRLTSAFAADAIGMDEYERRATAANTASSLDELERLTYDLPAPRRPADQAGSRASGRQGAAKERDRSEPAMRNAIDPSLIGAAPVTTGCVMGDRNLTGNWLSSDRVSAFTVMGSTKLDLRDADLPPGPVRIEAFTLMGETKVIVPRGLPVRLNAFAFMGESTAGREVNQQIAGARTWVEISGFAMMGSVTVRALD